MPRLSSDRVPALRLHKQSGRAIVTLSGKDHLLGRFGSAEASAKYHELISRWIAAGRKPLNPAPVVKARDAHEGGTPGALPITIGALADAFQRNADAYYRTPDGKPTREAANVKDALRPLREHFRDLAADRFGPTAFKTVRDAMIGKGWCRRHVNQSMKRVRRCFKWGVENELVPPAVWQALGAVEPLKAGRTRAPETDPIQPIDDETVETTLRYLSPTVAAMVRLQRLTGMRPAEVCAMRPSEIDRTGDVWVYKPSRHKTQFHGKARMIAIGPRGQLILQPLLERRIDPTGYIFRPADAIEEVRAARAAARKTPASCGNRAGTNRKSKPVKQPGECYTSATYLRAIRYACERADIEPWAPNRLRHAAATEIRRGFGLEAAQVTLGHSRADTTQIYAERDLQAAIRIAAQIG